MTRADFTRAVDVISTKLSKKTGARSNVHPEHLYDSYLHACHLGYRYLYIYLMSTAKHHLFKHHSHNVIARLATDISRLVVDSLEVGAPFLLQNYIRQPPWTSSLVFCVRCAMSNYTVIMFLKRLELGSLGDITARGTDDWKYHQEISDKCMFTGSAVHEKLIEF